MRKIAVLAAFAFIVAAVTHIVLTTDFNAGGPRCEPRAIIKLRPGDPTVGFAVNPANFDRLTILDCGDGLAHLQFDENVSEYSQK
jgi:hypothetical protein